MSRAAEFLTPLDVELVNGLACGGRGIWRITRPLVYYSAILGRQITIEIGFLTDWASVPRIPVAYLLFGDTEHEEAVLHDWLFHHHEVCGEQMANMILLEASKANGSSWWRRMGIWLGVAIGGRSSWLADGIGNGHTIVDGKIV